MSEHLPPPTYSQRDLVETLVEPQILIIPTVDAVNFQKGFLGAEGERAAIEGELQLKGADVNQWTRITIALRSFENAYAQEIELGYNEIELFSKKEEDETIPSSIPFSIQLLPDTPQSLQTPHSILAHTLTATLHPARPHLAPVFKSLTVHTRRYTSHPHTIPPSPETHALEEPTRIQVQLPQHTFTADEIIPLYITIPPPSRETVLDRGLRLRNVRAELIRVIKVKREHVDETDPGSDDDINPEELEQLQGSSTWNYNIGNLNLQEPSHSSSSKTPLSPLFLGSSYRALIAQSGASCRFHSTRSIQLRFILHQSTSGTPSDSRTTVDRIDSDTESALISQSTLLHTVSFHIKVHVSFVDTSNQTERISTLIIPVTILAPPAPLPQVSQAIDDAYQKKHDRPPTSTNREEESDPSIPRYSEGEAGPSMLAGAPPPFEERDAPPPFFASALEAEASTSSRLPTFQESEHEIILPEDSDLLNAIPVLSTIPGEGSLFGFHASQQFDGHSEEQSLTPPPSMDMESHVDLTALADQSSISYETLGIVLNASEDGANIAEQPPPPPPAMDDPSDPPPSIDSEFRSPIAVQEAASGQSANSIHPAYHGADTLRIHAPTPTLPADLPSASDGHAPPPYLIPESHREGEGDQVMRPPPYVD